MLQDLESWSWRRRSC